MSSHSTPRILSFKSTAAIARGLAVKAGADRDHVQVASAATDKIIGLSASSCSAAESTLEVAINAGGAKGLAGGNISFGDLLTSDGNGALIATTSATNRIVGMAMEDAVAGDLFAVEIAVSLI